MATYERVQKLEKDIKRLHGLREMKAFLLNAHPTPDNLEIYYAADDKMDAKLDELFAASIMFYKVERPHLYDLYMKYTKEQVKAKLLRRITKSDPEQYYNQLAIQRLDALEKEKAVLTKKHPRSARLQYVLKTITRLRAWTKDLNYETKRGTKTYKR